ncbi:MAG TPA: hypothetical protein VM734_33740 [Kofleriaceae bacterium]|nr:hypothetical protein [Kofleriaceae bacterium]
MPRRRWFAAPLVLTFSSPLACSSRAPAVEAKQGDPKPPANPLAGFATVIPNGTACTYNVQVRCPKDISCNPPPPMAIECPPGMGDMPAVHVGALGDGGCVMVPYGCGDLACAVPVPCPSPGQPLAPLSWAVNPADDGRCLASPGPRTNFEDPGPAVAIDCPLAERHGFIERKTPDAPCLACATAPCEPPAAVTVPCPAAS